MFSCLWLGSQLGFGSCPFSTGVSVSPHPLSVLISSVSVDRTSARTPVPVGSKTFMGELGR